MRDRSGAAAEGEGFSLEAEDPLHRAQQALGLIPRSGGFGLGRRIAIAIAITWLPLILYAVWQHVLLPGSVPEPLFRHFGIHARFLIALPLLIVAESTLDGALRRILPQFTARGLVDADLRPAFLAILERARRLRSSRTALGVMIGLIAVATLLGWVRSDEIHELVWESSGATAPLRLGAFWLSFVSRPIFLLALVAWIWRLAVLAWMFSRIAGLELRLAPTHPDRTGGLGFLEQITVGLAPVFFAVSVPIAGRWGHDALYHGMDVHSLKVPAVALVLVQLLLALTPLLAFSPLLRRVRRKAIAEYGALLAEYGRRVERRWLRREVVEDDGLLSAPELGPVADTGALYEAVANMRTAPIGRRSLLPIALASALPMIPVFATQIPLREILTKLLAPLVGL